MQRDLVVLQHLDDGPLQVGHAVAELEGLVVDLVRFQVLLVVELELVDAVKPGDSVRYEVKFTWPMLDLKLELLQVERPASELATKVRLSKKPEQRAVVRDEQEAHALEVVSPLANAVNDAEGLELVDGVLLFCGG